MNDRAEPGSYGQFCPVAMAAEIICSRWTILVLRELLCGTSRFNDIRRGVPRMSPTLLSKRLKELEEAGLVVARATGPGGVVEYKLTEAGQDLNGIVNMMGEWGQKWVQSSISLKNLDPTLLMWDMRRNIVPTALPDRRCTLKFIYPELNASHRSWWLVVERGDVDLCKVDPGHDIDLYVHSSLYSMTSVWMGVSTLKAEIEAGKIVLSGDTAIARSMHSWFGLNPLAKLKSRVSA